MNNEEIFWQTYTIHVMPFVGLPNIFTVDFSLIRHNQSFGTVERDDLAKPSHIKAIVELVNDGWAVKLDTIELDHNAEMKKLFEGEALRRVKEFTKS